MHASHRRRTGTGMDMTEIIQKEGLIHLRNEKISYIMRVMPENALAHIYFGRRIREIDPDQILRSAGSKGVTEYTNQECGQDRLPQEYPVFGLGDQRDGALRIENRDGSVAADLRFVSAEMMEKKPGLSGLPATFGEDGRSLRITLRDPVSDLEVQLLYTIFDHSAVVTRSALIVNHGSAPVQVEKAMSLALEVPDSDWELITLSGAWARERHVYRRKLVPGHQGVSTQCGASSLQQSPFLALARRETTEEQGEAIAAALIYSGSFTAQASVYQNGGTRLLMGINDADFRWTLGSGEAFQTPEAALVYSGEGLGGMSREFHSLWEEHLLPPRWVHAHRPVLLNSWEAAYFDFDEEKLVSIAESAAKAGVELFVMDDGWFGHRDDDTTSLGDWNVDMRKLPGGLERLGERVRALGLQFGIWMEPEMVSPDSDLYRAHPEWAIQIHGREGITARHQFILDLSRPEVQDFIVTSVSETLKASGAAYLKWDMNRNFSNIGSAYLPADRQRELPHRYILGLYAVMERLTQAFPEVLFEGCSSGGGRFDPGMLYYTPQFWCSDDTDALCRCEIQYGTTMFLPPSTMGSHVSAVPNHQTGRSAPLKTRFAVALGGCFGYELDPRKLSEEEQADLREQVSYARRTERTRLHGKLYRLRSPFEGNDTAWITVSPDQKEAVFTLVRSRAIPNVPPALIRLAGLNPEKKYRIEETGAEFYGDEMMYSGVSCPLSWGDAACLLYTIREV